jgi:L-ascorbate metabolism protein UlaG (beta-lactamase superfamily)
MKLMHTIVLPGEPQNSEVEHGSLLFIGTATVLLRYAGFTILTDPNFLPQGEHVHLGYGLRSARLTNPALAFADLPPFDLVLLSHLHEDHFDRLVARKLDKQTPIVTTPQATTALHKQGFRKAQQLSTWETLTIARGECRLHLTALPAKHGPGLIARLLPQVMGTMLDFETATGKHPLRIYISGDTLMYKELREIPKRYPDIDLALLHLGGTKLLGLLLTMNGLQGVKALKLINPHKAIPIHYNDYTVFASPLEDFQGAVREADLEQRVSYLRQGETYNFEVPVQRG